MSRTRGRGHVGPERGVVIPFVAMSLAVLVTFTALAVDLGRVSLERRDLQAVADAVALDMGRLIDGRPASEILADPRWDAQFAASRARNHFPVGGDRQLQRALGCYQRTADVFDTGCPIPDSVRVSAGNTISYVFWPGSNDTSRQAIASASQEVEFTLGSFAVRLATDGSPLLKPILDAFGLGSLGIDLISYQGLADAAISVPLLATELGLNAASPDQVLNTSVSAVELIDAAATVLERSGGDLADVALLRLIALNFPDPDATLTIGELLSVGTDGSSAVTGGLNVLDLLTTSLLIADGDHAVDLDLAGLGIVNLELVEAARRARGGIGTELTTSQIKLGIGALPGFAEARVDIATAGAEARIAAISCQPAAQSVDFSVTPSLASLDAAVSLRLGDILVVGPLVWLALGLLGVNENTTLDVSLTVESESGPTYSVPFDFPPDVFDEPGVPRDQVTRRQTPGASLDVGSVQPVLHLQNGGAVLDVVDQVLALVGGLITPIVDTFRQQVNDLVVPLLEQLGLVLAGADLTVNDITCADLYLTR